MSLSKNKSGIKSNVSPDEVMSSGKSSNNLVVRINQDSDDNLQALFDSVLKPSDSKRPLQVPFRMRKLPNSFFNPPAANIRSPSASHSRTNSADSAYDAGSQSNVNQTALGAVPKVPPPTAVANVNLPTERLAICHLRAHSSPASLEQTYSMHSGNIDLNTANCGQEGNFSSNMINFSPGVNETSVMGINNISRCINPETPSSTLPFHMKQRSYDVVSPIQLQNELGALPAGWEQAKTNDGQLYYLNHATKTTQWEDPRIQLKQERALQHALSQTANLKNITKESSTLTDNLGPLPEGWEQAYTDSGDIYFINHINRTTSWNDPRIPDFLQKSLKIPKAEVNWANICQPEKDHEFFKQKPEQEVLARHGASLQIDPFLSGDNHARQESSDSGLSLTSNTFSVNADFISQIDESMDCISETGTINALNGLDCPDNLVSSLQLDDNICSEMFSEVHNMLNSSSSKPDNLEWYKIN